MGLFAFNYGTILIILFGLSGWFFFSIRSRHERPSQPAKSEKKLDMEFYLYKMARVTGNSEYDIFFKSAEKRPVSKNMVERDFGDYLRKGRIPHYVIDFVTANKHHLDELRIPRW